MYQIRLQMVREPIKGYERSRTVCSGSQEIVDAMCPLLGDSPRELLYAVYLDCSNAVVGLYLVGAGTVDRAPCSPREVFGPALLANAVKIVLVHNHPTGEVEPSPADLKLTRVLIDAGRMMDLPIIDHIIIGYGGKWTSLRERGFV